ncbi:MAG: GNAT family N-acetyltransferase [Longimicrobiales bacterium]
MAKARRTGGLLRQATRRDARALAELWVRAFPDERTVDDRVRQLESRALYGGIDDCWMLERAGHLVAGCRLYPFRQFLAGAELPMLGLGAVAVAPQARRQGIGAALCRDALRIGRERGDVVSALYPFRPDFYRALGWGYVGTLLGFRFAARALESDAELVAGVRLAGQDDRPAIERCFARVAERSHGPIRRPAGAWDAHLAAPTDVVLHEDAGTLRGYLLVQRGRQRVAADRTLTVRELVAEGAVAYRALLGWIGAQADQWPQITYEARPDECFDLRLRDPRPPRFRPSRRRLWDPVARALRGPMLRVLDVPRALESRAWGAAPDSGFRARIEVRDRELPENAGPWAVEVGAGVARVVQGPCDAADASLIVEPATFAQIWAGEMAPSTACRLGSAQVEDPERLLDAAFAVSQSFWLPDAF